MTSKETRTSEKRDQNLGGFLVPLVEKTLKFLSFFSVYSLFFKLMKRRKKWSDDELIPFWFAEAYTLMFLAILALGYWKIEVYSPLWTTWLYISIYRLFDLARGLASIFVFEPRRRKDDQGGYILVRHSSRWVLLVLINLLEVSFCFAFMYVTWGEFFNPIIVTKVHGMYQSVAAFLAGAGAVPINDIGRIIALAQFGYFLLFLVVFVPVTISVLRGKEITNEILREDPKN